jgi:hypothetical protein
MNKKDDRTERVNVLDSKGANYSLTMDQYEIHRKMEFAKSSDNFLRTVGILAAMPEPKNCARTPRGYLGNKFLDGSGSRQAKHHQHRNLS